MGFLQPWNQGPNKDYSENQQYTIGSNIILSWSIDFDDPDLQLWQDNLPGDAQGGPWKYIKSQFFYATNICLRGIWLPQISLS